jgi:gamma-glutamylcyclotransferase (GGCT)/AIG2-like uncharacterized protein YtfP
MDFFVYGTLTEPERVEQVVESYAFLGPAVLRGLHPVSGTYPTLAPGGRVGGRLLRTDDVDALDAYEGVDQGLYVRVGVPREGVTGGGGAREDGADAAAPVFVYVGDPGALNAEAAVDWPGDGPLSERVERYVAEHGVVVSPSESRR